MIKNLGRLNRNMKVKWMQKFYDIKFNGFNQLEINLALKELKKYSLRDIRNEAKDLKMMYYISPNAHDGKWGLDKDNTPEGGGIIAQSKTYEGCLKRAQDEFGIHPIFIYGVDVDGW